MEIFTGNVLLVRTSVLNFGNDIWVTHSHTSSSDPRATSSPTGVGWYCVVRRSRTGVSLGVTVRVSSI